MRSTMTALLTLLAALGLAVPVAAQTPPSAPEPPAARQTEIQRVNNFQGVAGLLNLARGCVRVVAVVSPTAPGADAQMDTILSIVRANPSKRLRAYVVVTPAADATSPLQAALFAARHPGERVIYLWDPTAVVANLWKESVEIAVADMNAVFCLYDTAASFTVAPPTPDTWVHGRGEGRFNAHAFTDRTNELVRRVESKVAGAASRTP